MEGKFGNSRGEAWRALRKLLQRLTEPDHVSNTARLIQSRSPPTNGGLGNGRQLKTFSTLAYGQNIRRTGWQTQDILETQKRNIASVFLSYVSKVKKGFLRLSSERTEHCLCIPLPC